MSLGLFGHIQYNFSSQWSPLKVLQHTAPNDLEPGSQLNLGPRNSITSAQSSLLNPKSERNNLPELRFTVILIFCKSRFILGGTKHGDSQYI